ncbi:MAG: sialate O-acetylesterase [Verrucomicrobiota bacterium]|jgi:sialate O-acetylesterase
MKKSKPILHRHRINLILCAFAIAIAIPATAEVRLPRIFTDNMVLQRDLPVRVWGWADAGEAVSVTLAGSSASTKADEKGQWSLELAPFKTGENLELTVKGKNSLTLKNVVIGDLWVCSGQSNMEMDLGGCLGAAEDIKAADLPKIRRIKLNHGQAAQPDTDAPTATQWQVCSPDTARGFTAVGFYFAREIQQQTGVPIGIVDDNWGGTPIEPWVASENKEGKLKRFAVAGADKQWHWAEAVIDNDTVVVSSPEVKEPVAVRYAFQMNPDGANLYNREGLPASPFRTDTW